jgi:hypothetical protein
MPRQDARVDRPRCAYCGEIVGVYERARLLLADGSDRRGSPPTFGDARHAPGASVVHKGCYPEFERNRGIVGPRHQADGELL